MKFIKVGTDTSHVHFLLQSVLNYSVTRIVMKIKSLTAREIIKRKLEVKKILWRGVFWTDGCFSNTVNRYGNE